MRQLDETAKRLLSSILTEDSDGDDAHTHESEMAEKTLRRANAAQRFLDMKKKIDDMMHDHLEENGADMSPEHKRHFSNVDRTLARTERPLKKVASTSKAAGRSFRRRDSNVPEFVKKEPYSPVPPAKPQEPSSAAVKVVGKPGMVKK